MSLIYFSHFQTLDQKKKKKSISSRGLQDLYDSTSRLSYVSLSACTSEGQKGLLLFWLLLLRKKSQLVEWEDNKDATVSSASLSNMSNQKNGTGTSYMIVFTRNAEVNAIWFYTFFEYSSLCRTSLFFKLSANTILTVVHNLIRHSKPKYTKPIY